MSPKEHKKLEIDWGVWEEFFKAMREEGVNVDLKHVFSCEKDNMKAKLLMSSFPKCQYHFNDIEDIFQGHLWDMKAKKCPLKS